jgi:hypothetical protein
MTLLVLEMIPICSVVQNHWMKLLAPAVQVVLVMKDHEESSEIVLYVH